jgi:hypothetical protein
MPEPRYYPGILTEELRKTEETPSLVSRYPGTDLNREPQSVATSTCSVTYLIDVDQHFFYFPVFKHALSPLNRVQ